LKEDPLLLHATDSKLIDPKLGILLLLLFKPVLALPLLDPPPIPPQVLFEIPMVVADES
jgi:hypothetical protein